MQRFGEKLHILRIKNSLTLKGLASMLGLRAHGYISELEASKKVPTADFVLQISRLFNVSIDILLKEELNLPQEQESKEMTLPYIHREPTNSELEKLRLILSTYQDGSGQQSNKDGSTQPGWRDFERSFAAAYGGIAQESKFIFDVLIPHNTLDNCFFGFSCKMRRTLTDTLRTGRVTLELSNSSGKFWQALAQASLDQLNYRQNPDTVAKILLDLVSGWHQEVSINFGGRIDVDNSYYIALSWSKDGTYQLFQYQLRLPDPKKIEWDFPSSSTSTGKRLRGRDSDGMLFEWYGESGAQLKYYPKVSDAVWKSEIFKLESLEPGSVLGNLLINKAKSYFPAQWKSLIETNQ